MRSLSAALCALVIAIAAQACRSSCGEPSSLEPGQDLPSLGCNELSSDLPDSGGATGGATGTGGSASGGVPATGGMPATGGITATGGMPAMGGMGGGE